MGSKPSHAMESNRPESGGADRDDLREKSGLLDREKEAFAKSEAQKRESRESRESRETRATGEREADVDRSRDDRDEND